MAVFPAIREGSDVVPDLYANLVAALVYALLGILVFAASFFILDRLTPYSLWVEIVERQNGALATLIGLVSLGICVIIAAAIF
jgi:putative membrane protein